MGSTERSKRSVTAVRRNRRSAIRSDSAPWAANRLGVSKAIVGGGRRDGDDAASESSQKAIVVEHTVDVNTGPASPYTGR